MKSFAISAKECPEFTCPKLSKFKNEWTFGNPFPLASMAHTRRDIETIIKAAGEVAEEMSRPEDPA